MRICFLAPASNYHTKKWCEYFTSKGHEVHVISFINAAIGKVKVHYIDCGVEADSADSSKIKYLYKAKEVKRVIDTINPDIVNVHYASSYGAVAALSGRKGYTLSVWGSDVYDFPQKSFFHKCLIKYSLHKAKYIFSTSIAMADETNKYTRKKIEITPFGVKMDLFHPQKRTRVSDGKIVIGNIKALDYKYGIDYLLKATAIIKEKIGDRLEVRIAGKGPAEEALKTLSYELGIDDVVTWLGFLPQEQVATEWANMDIAVVNSSSCSESFGVAAVEAQACATPVIVTDIPGLKESTEPGISSIVVPCCNEVLLSEAILQLVDSFEKRLEMGRAGREYVVSKYEYESCFNYIEELFMSQINRKGK